MQSRLETFGRRNESLARHTTMRVGGTAQWWVEPQSEAELVAVLEAVRQSGQPLQVFGAGSNLVAGDAELEGVALKLGEGFAWHRVEGHRLITGGATMLPKLTKFALQQRLGNLEWACGVPGSVGGSLWGNAGARGFNGRDMEACDAAADLESLVAYDRAGQRHCLRRGDIEFAYRRSSLGELIVTEATFALKPLDEKQALEHREAVKALLQKRRETQPTNAASAGCVWKNPALPDCRGAGELIERLGLKGHRVGGAAVSAVHANFVVNEGGATGNEVRTLIREVEATVRRETSAQLEREVRLLGE